MEVKLYAICIEYAHEGVDGIRSIAKKGVFGSVPMHLHPVPNDLHLVPIDLHNRTK